MTQNLPRGIWQVCRKEKKTERGGSIEGLGRVPKTL